MGHEAAVDLHGVHRHLVQAGQARIAGAEVVQRQAHAQVLQPAQRGLHALVLRRQALGHFQLQLRRLHGVRCQQVAHIVHQSRPAQLRARQVHRQLLRRKAAHGALPAHELAAGLVQHLRAQFIDEATLLGHADEFHRWHQPAQRMAPAHQRLHTHHARGGEVDHRLVDDEQLVQAQRAAQVGLHHQRAHHPLVHRVVEQHPAAAAAALGLVHRGVGIAQHLLGAGHAALGLSTCQVRAQHQADAGTALHRVVVDGVGLRHLFEQTLRDGAGRGHVVHTFQHHHELVAAEARGHLGLQARHRIAWAQGARQAPRDLAQQFVAGAMTQRVVDLLEAVEVHEQDGEAIGRMAATVGDGAFQALHHHGAVGQVGQRVGAGAVAQTVLQCAAFGDVAEAGHDTGDVALRVALRLGVDQQPTRRSVGRADPQGLVAQRAAAGQRAHRGLLFARVGAAVSAHNTPARVRRQQALHLGQVQAEQALGRRVGFDDAAGGRLHHHAGRQRREHSLHLALLPHAGADVAAHAHKAAQHPGLVMQRAQVDVQPQFLPIPCAVQPFMARPEACPQRLVHRAQHVLVGLGAGQQLPRPVADGLAERPAGGLLEGGVDPHDQVVRVADQHQRAGVLGHQGQALQRVGLLAQAAAVAAHGAGCGLDHAQTQ